MVEIKFAKINESAVIPNKRVEDAGFDVFSCFDEPYIIIEPNQTLRISTGIASSFPQNYCIILKERGSTGSIGIGQRSGVIDSGYRNEWLVPITNHNSKPLLILKNEFKSTDEYRELLTQKEYIEYSYEKAICQGLLIPVPASEIVEVSYDQLLKIKSERMLDGFGSTNK